jgi:hypothetical protein
VNDFERAYRCFEKAFELDAGEADAAERLAHRFADSRQWDLVEVVARRLLQATRKRISTRREVAWPYRALGVAELVFITESMLIAEQPKLRNRNSIISSCIEKFASRCPCMGRTG